MRGRLQRPVDFTGPRLDRFRQVLLRHGLPGALLGAACLLVPDMRGLLDDALAAGRAEPLRYLSTGLVLFGVLLGWLWWRDRRLDGLAVAWVAYLLAVSVWEEWVFRLAVPLYAHEHGIDLRTAVIACNAAFALMHWFTLRWKWQWCLAAFFGGMGLSRLLHGQGDLLLVVAVHWVATFANTPRPPGRGAGWGNG